jgi:hypothetical protein
MLYASRIGTRSQDNILKKDIVGMILRSIVMIGILIVVIYGMTTSLIFYLMNLPHLT